MKRVDEYITEKEVKDYCSDCNEICTRHCVIWRKAELRYNEEVIRQQKWECRNEGQSTE